MAVIRCSSQSESRNRNQRSAKLRFLSRQPERSAFIKSSAFSFWIAKRLLALTRDPCQVHSTAFPPSRLETGGAESQEALMATDDTRERQGFGNTAAPDDHPPKTMDVQGAPQSAASDGTSSSGTMNNEDPADRLGKP